MCVLIFILWCPPVLRIRIPDPVPFWPLDPGSGIGKKSGSGIRIQDEQPGSYFRELRKQFFGLKYLNSSMRIRKPEAYPGSFWSWFQDGKNLDPGSGVNIPDPHPCLRGTWKHEIFFQFFQFYLPWPESDPQQWKKICVLIFILWFPPVLRIRILDPVPFWSRIGDG